MNPNFSNNTSNNPHDAKFVDSSAVGAAGRMITHMAGAKPAPAPQASAEPSAAHRLATAAAGVDEFKIGESTTCQFGNPGDTDWSEATHANVPVLIVDKQRCTVTFRMYYLVAKLSDREYVGRASDSRGSDSVMGDTYCTNARTFGSKAKGWTGITSFVGAADSLGFKLPIYDAQWLPQKLENVQAFDAALYHLGNYFEALIADSDEPAVRALFKRDHDEKEAIIRTIWKNS